MNRIKTAIGICLLMALHVPAEILVYEGFGYGAVTGFVNNVSNPDAAGGIGFASAGWKQFNTYTNGLVFNNDAASLLTPGGYSLTKTNGYMSVARGANTSATWALRDLAPVYSMDTNTTYWFSVIIRNMDNTISSADISSLYLRDDSTSIVSMGFDSNERLLISLGSPVVSATGTDTNLFFKGNHITLLAKLVLSSAGSDTLYVSAFKNNQTISGEPVSWDLSVTAELGNAVINNLGVNAGSGNSNVNVDEIRMGRTFADVTREPPRFRLVLLH